MGAPYFEWEALFKAHDVAVLSSNYTLYGDMSWRVMQTLMTFSPDVEIYSIDEAFLGLEVGDTLIGKEIRAKVLQWTGIPVSVGIGPTKTIAKAANRLAKSHLGVFQLGGADELKSFPIEEIWGIGPGLTARLKKLGVQSAYEFAMLDISQIKKHLGIVGVRCAMELRGLSCLKLSEVEPAKKGIVCSRSFSKPVSELNALEESVALYAAKAGERMRRQGSSASFMQVALIANPFNPELAPFSRALSITFPEPTDYTPYLIEKAKSALAALFVEGIPYKKSSIFLGGLTPKGEGLRDLFEPTIVDRAKQTRLMRLMDSLNKGKNRPKLQFAAEGIDRPWQMKRQNVSPSYTTSWEDLIFVN